MSGRQLPPQEGASDYEQDRRFLLALASFLDLLMQAETEKLIDPATGRAPKLSTSLAEGIVSIERRGQRAAHSGIRMALRDLLEISRELSAEQVREVDDRMLSAGLPTLTARRERESVPKSLKRGTIRSENEFRVLSGRADEIHADSSKTEEMAQINSLLATYLERRVTKRRSP
jgi:hypothetical protein